jgi:hypothetical protein
MLRVVVVGVSSLILSAAGWSQVAGGPDVLGIDHRYTNTDAQSLIGLPLGSHKTTVEKNGSLKWSQWSLKRREMDSPIGFSAQMDGDLAIEPFAGETAMKLGVQTLYKARYPFVVTEFARGGVKLEELAFSADPEADLTRMPTAESGAKGLDVVRLVFTNDGSETEKIRLKLSGRERNLPGHMEGDALITHAGEDVALLSGAAVTPEDGGLTLAVRATLGAKESKTIWVRLPYEWSASRNSEVSKLGGEELLAKAVAQWDGIWARGANVRYPEQVGDVASVERTPTTLGTVVSVKATRTVTGWRVEFDPGTRALETLVHVPLAVGAKLSEAKMDGKTLPMSSVHLSANGEQAIAAAGEISRPVVFEFSVVGGAR